jgi:transglutaminase-like putative cysteine protease
VHVHIGCQFSYAAEVPTAAIVQVEPHPAAVAHLVTQDWDVAPLFELRAYYDLFGNLCRRGTLPAGPSSLRYDAVVEVGDELDPWAPDAPEIPPDQLPDEALIFTAPSRFCLPDELGSVAWDNFGDMAPGWGRVQAVCDFVHRHLAFAYGSSGPMTTALDAYRNGTGVCRDYAHLAISLCRALNIPSRYAFGYLPPVPDEPADAPRDFCAWMEVYLGGRWWTFDPRNNRRSTGRILIGRGRDAIDVAMVTTFGGPQLIDMEVWADRLDPT